MAFMAGTPRVEIKLVNTVRPITKRSRDDMAIANEDYPAMVFWRRGHVLR